MTEKRLGCASGSLIPPENNGKGSGTDGRGEIIYHLPMTDETIGMALRGEVTIRGRDVRDGMNVFVATKPMPDTKI